MAMHAALDHAAGRSTINLVQRAALESHRGPKELDGTLYMQKVFAELPRILQDSCMAAGLSPVEFQRQWKKLADGDGRPEIERLR